MAKPGSGGGPSRIPFAILDGGQVRSTPGTEPSAGAAGRVELLTIWDLLSSERRKALLTVARKIAEAPE